MAKARVTFTLNDLNQRADDLRALSGAIAELEQKIKPAEQKIAQLASAQSENKTQAENAAKAANAAPKPGFFESLFGWNSAKTIEKKKQELTSASQAAHKKFEQAAQDLKTQQAALQPNKERYIQLLGKKEALTTRLVTEPVRCLTELMAQLIACHRNYEKEYCINQSEYERQRLLNIRQQIQVIHEKSAEMKAIDDRYARERYFQLCGMIYVAGENSQRVDKAFRTVLASVHAMNGLINPSDAIKQYEQFKKASPEVSDVKTIREREAVDFKKARDILEKTIGQMEAPMRDPAVRDSKKVKKLCEHSRNLLNLFTRYNEEYESGKRPDFDIKFRIAILRTTNELLRTPKEEHVSGASSSKPSLALQKNLDCYQRYIAAEKNGRPVMAKKIVGAMMMFLGAFFAIVGVAGLAGSMGLSLGASGIMAVAGVTMFAAGVSLFKGGMRKGVSKSLVTIQNSVNYETSWRLGRWGVFASPSAGAAQPPSQPNHQPAVSRPAA